MIRLSIPLVCLGAWLAAAGPVRSEPEAAPAPPPPTAAATAPPSPPALAPIAAFAGKLRWNNGETLQGEAVEATTTELAWRTPLFLDPLRVRWGALNRIDQPLPSKAAPDACAVVLRDGSFLYGDLLGANAASFLIRSERHGEVAVKRAEVAAIHRLHGGAALWTGPVGDIGWNVVTDERNLPDPKKAPGPPPTVPTLVGAAGGTLVLPYFNRGAFLGLSLPHAVDVQIRVRATGRPDFRLALNSDTKEGSLRIETWDDQLVAAAGSEFQFIRRLAENEHEVALRVCWDQHSRHCAFFTPTGEPLAEWQAPVDATRARAGIHLQNKGRDLALEFLRVAPWDGQPPSVFKDGQPRVELKDGRILAGRIVSASPADGVVFEAAGGEAAATSFPLGDVEDIELPAEAPEAGASDVTLSFADGTLLHGAFTEIKNGSALLRTTFTETPLPLRLGGTRQVLIKATGLPERPLSAMDRINFGAVALHGQLVCSGKPVPQWIPVGGSVPATPDGTAAGEIDRALPADAAFAAAPALFFTRAGDVLPGQLHALDRAGVEIDSPFFAATKLAADNLDAVQFTGGGKANLSDFDDPSWQILRGDKASVKRTGNAVTMQADSSLGNAVAMQGREISFQLEHGGYAATRLRMFCAGVDPKTSTSLLLMVNGNQVISGPETRNGQFGEQTRTKVEAGPIRVRLVLTDKAVELYINDAWAQQLEIEAAGRAGSGLIVEPGSFWGNNSRPISLSHFQVASTPGQVPLADVNTEAKTQALTIPRFHKEDPPRHALLALNGDVLRGEIEGITVSHLDFRTGLENLSVPRDRVRAAIWLKQPTTSAEPAAPVVENAVPKPLDQVITRNARFHNAGLGTLLNFLKLDAPGLVFKGATKQDGHMVEMQFSGQTIGAALDKICTLFGLAYRFDNEGAIVLEPAPASAAAGKKELVEKVYWLKPAAFPGTPAAQAILAQKGLVFPPGSSARWEAGACQLVVKHTAAGHDQLAGLLASDFGGSEGSPTHWLLLGNGARLGLAVDRFDADAVVGHHPVYGACRVPLAEVCSIRTAPLPPSAGMKTLRDWQLAFAPEPVLPDASGENSPLLGKQAKGFKLHLLGGGDLDLGKEKGRVLVLDFWATWCGPCIKSLPGLIEAVAAFPPDRVKLVGLDQGEPDEQVKRFLEARGWKLTVAMDSAQDVGRLYGVDGIPHTVIIAPDGTVAWVKTGYDPEGDAEVTAEIKKLLAPAAAPGGPPSPVPAPSASPAPTPAPAATPPQVALRQAGP